MDAQELAYAGVVRTADLIRSKEVSAREVVETSLERIERLDPAINAFRSVYAEQALEEAKGINRRLRAKSPPPLLGVPVAIKDNFDVAGDVTTHGSNAYGEPAAADSEVVRRVREAGAIVVGKTHLPELAALCTTESATFGLSRNPWNPERTTGGSSGGSAAAVAAGMVPAALASDGLGSIRIPAACCGVFGLKPQRGRISLAPLAEHWYGLTVAGWETRGVADGALMLDASAGAHPTDAESPPEPEGSFADAAATAPGSLRIAYSLELPEGFVGLKIDDEVRAALSATVELLGSLGHRVEERKPDYGFGLIPSMLRFLAGVAEDSDAMPHAERLERRTRGWARMGRRIRGRALDWALAQEAPTRERMGRIFDDFDVVLTPVTTVPAWELGRWEGRGPIWTFNGMGQVVPFPGIWNQTGQPAATVPAGFTREGLPLGVQLVGPANSEGTLLSLAAQIQSERDWTERRPAI